MFLSKLKIDEFVKSQISPPPRKDLGIFDWGEGIFGLFTRLLKLFLTISPAD